MTICRRHSRSRPQRPHPPSAPSRFGPQRLEPTVPSREIARPTIAASREEGAGTNNSKQVFCDTTREPISPMTRREALQPGVAVRTPSQKTPRAHYGRHHRRPAKWSGNVNSENPQRHVRSVTAILNRAIRMDGGVRMRARRSRARSAKRMFAIVGCAHDRRVGMVGIQRMPFFLEPGESAWETDTHR